MKNYLSTILLIITLSTYAQSTKELLKEANAGIPSSQYKIGLQYFNGKDVLTDKKKAAFWIRNAYDNGYLKAKTTWDKLNLWKYFDEDSYVQKKGLQTKAIPWSIKGNTGVVQMVAVKKGDTIKVTASGSVVLGMMAGSCGPEGLARGFQNYNEVRGANHGALLCRIGHEGYWTHLGKSKTFVADTSGNLYFLINDADPRNNSGKFEGTLTVITQ